MTSSTHSTRGTGRLEGAINRVYSLGEGMIGHEQIKENQAVFNDFLPYLNSVPPAPAVELSVDRSSGHYSGPLNLVIAVDPPTRAVAATASRITKAFIAGFVIDKIPEAQHLTLFDRQSITLASSGMWQLTLRVDGATDDLVRTYWVDVPAIVTTIQTDNTAPFENSLQCRYRGRADSDNLLFSGRLGGMRVPLASSPRTPPCPSSRSRRPGWPARPFRGRSTKPFEGRSRRATTSVLTICDCRAALLERTKNLRAGRSYSARSRSLRCARSLRSCSTRAVAVSP